MENIKYDSISNDFYVSNTSEETILPQIIWHITDRCFLSCPYCFATKTGRETNIDNLESSLEVFKALGVQKVDIAGGDPLTYSNLATICYELSKSGIEMTLTTSGVGKKDVKEWLISNADIFSWILVSIDAPTSDKHDSLRGKKGTFEQLNELIKELKNNDFNNIRINTVVTKSFYEKDFIENFIDLIQKIQPKEWCLIQPHPANKKEKYDEYATTKKEFNSLMDEIKQKVNSKSVNDIKITSRYNDNYSKYWVLYPNGKLKQHTENSDDRFDFDFSIKNINDIKSSVKKFGVWVPMKEGEN